MNLTLVQLREQVEAVLVECKNFQSLYFLRLSRLNDALEGLAESAKKQDELARKCQHLADTLTRLMEGEIDGIA
jgi:hypothetical protein